MLLTSYPSSPEQQEDGLRFDPETAGLYRPSSSYFEVLPPREYGPAVALTEAEEAELTKLAYLAAAPVSPALRRAA